MRVLCVTRKRSYWQYLFALRGFPEEKPFGVPAIGDHNMVRSQKGGHRCGAVVHSWSGKESVSPCGEWESGSWSQSREVRAHRLGFCVEHRICFEESIAQSCLFLVPFHGLKLMGDRPVKLRPTDTKRYASADSHIHPKRMQRRWRGSDTGKTLRLPFPSARQKG